MKDNHNHNLFYYLPLLFLLCLSGNPLFTSNIYSKEILLIYTFSFLFFSLVLVKLKLPKRGVIQILIVVLSIIVLVFLQGVALGFVSYPGVFVLILKILLGFFTLVFYKKKNIDFIDTYIKLTAILAALSIPFFIINQFDSFGIILNHGHSRSIFLYTFTQKGIADSAPINQNSGMFWEPGVFAGYLNLALVFIAIKNGKFRIGNYRREIIWIVAGVLTSMSTAGYIVLSIIIVIFSMQSFGWAKIVIIPILGLLLFLTFSKFQFLEDKIMGQLIESQEMSQGDFSNTRFGSLISDFEYIRSRPFIGNGLDARTRYRFNPEVIEKLRYTGHLGNGNGFSNFIAYWGIPFFLFWLFCVYKLAYQVSGSKKTSMFVIFVLILILQGEQFLNFPLFLSFFIAHVILEKKSTITDNHDKVAVVNQSS